MIAVLFFGRMADLAGQRRLDVAPAPGGDSLFALRDRVMGEAMAAGRVAVADIRMSVNRVVQVTDCPVTDGDEVAFFSVFSGG